jgi:uncharacterized protein YceK
MAGNVERPQHSLELRNIKQEGHRMNAAPGTALSALALVVAMALAGCSSPAAPTPPQASADATVAPTDFCTEFEAAGGTAGTFGGVALFLKKDALIAGIDEALAALSVTPPDEVAKPWGTLEAYFEKARAEAEKLESGDILSDPELLNESLTLSDEIDVLTDYYFETCVVIR